MSKKIICIGLTALLMTAISCRSVADTSLSLAAAKGDYASVMALLGQGVDPNDMDSQGFTPLMWAARYGHEEIIKSLCEAGADLNATDTGSNHWTALIHAIHKRQNRAAILLMGSGADVNAKARGGATALMVAAGYGNTEMVKVLLDHGADPYAEASDGVSPLTNAVSGAWDIDSPFAGLCHTETVKTLFRAAPDLSLGDSFPSRVALWLARKKGCNEIVSIIEKHDKFNQ